MSKDHPRSRGVYLHHWEVISASLGSSPLARGLLAGRHRVDGATRIIPARAGFTQECESCDDADSGSSPLARGLQVDCGGDNDVEGIIPARAGFTD